MMEGHLHHKVLVTTIQRTFQKWTLWQRLLCLESLWVGFVLKGTMCRTCLSQVKKCVHTNPAHSPFKSSNSFEKGGDVDWPWV